MNFLTRQFFLTRQSKRGRFELLMFAGLIAVSIFGCGRGDGLTLVPVEGTVTVGDDEPFAGGIVRFTSSGSTKSAGGTAVTDDDGSFVVKYQGRKNGLEPGEYKVSFSLYKMPDGTALPDQDGEDDPKSPQELGAIDFVPVEYSSISSDKNIVTVKKASSKFEFKIPALNKPKGGKVRR